MRFITIFILQFLISNFAFAKFECVYTCHIGIIVRDEVGRPLYYTTVTTMQQEAGMSTKVDPKPTDSISALNDLGNYIDNLAKNSCLENLRNKYSEINISQTQEDNNLIFATPAEYVGGSCEYDLLSKHVSARATKESALKYFCPNIPIMTIEPEKFALKYRREEYLKANNTSIGKKCIDEYFSKK